MDIELNYSKNNSNISSSAVLGIERKLETFHQTSNYKNSNMESPKNNKSSFFAKQANSIIQPGNMNTNDKNDKIRLQNKSQSQHMQLKYYVQNEGSATKSLFQSPKKNFFGKNQLSQNTPRYQNNNSGKTNYIQSMLKSSSNYQSQNNIDSNNAYQKQNNDNILDSNNNYNINSNSNDYINSNNQQPHEMKKQFNSSFINQKISKQYATSRHRMQLGGQMDEINYKQSLNQSQYSNGNQSLNQSGLNFTSQNFGKKFGQQSFYKHQNIYNVKDYGTLQKTIMQQSKITNGEDHQENLKKQKLIEYFKNRVTNYIFQLQHNKDLANEVFKQIPLNKKDKHSKNNSIDHHNSLIFNSSDLNVSQFYDQSIDDIDKSSLGKIGKNRFNYDKQLQYVSQDISIVCFDVKSGNHIKKTMEQEQFQEYLMDKVKVFIDNDKYDYEKKMKKVEEEYQKLIQNLRENSHIVRVPINLKVKNESYNDFYEPDPEYLKIYKLRLLDQQINRKDFNRIKGHSKSVVFEKRQLFSLPNSESEDEEELEEEKSGDEENQDSDRSSMSEESKLRSQQRLSNGDYKIRKSKNPTQLTKVTKKKVKKEKVYKDYEAKQNEEEPVLQQKPKKKQKMGMKELLAQIDQENENIDKKKLMEQIRRKQKEKKYSLHNESINLPQSFKDPIVKDRVVEQIKEQESDQESSPKVKEKVYKAVGGKKTKVYHRKSQKKPSKNNDSDEFIPEKAPSPIQKEKKKIEEPEKKIEKIEKKEKKPYVYVPQVKKQEEIIEDEPQEEEKVEEEQQNDIEIEEPIRQNNVSQKKQTHKQQIPMQAKQNFKVPEFKPKESPKIKKEETKKQSPIKKQKTYEKVEISKKSSQEPIEKQEESIEVEQKDESKEEEQVEQEQIVEEKVEEPQQQPPKSILKKKTVKVEAKEEPAQEEPVDEEQPQIEKYGSQQDFEDEVKRIEEAQNKTKNKTKRMKGKKTTKTIQGKKILDFSTLDKLLELNDVGDFDLSEFRNVEDYDVDYPGDRFEEEQDKMVYEKLIKWQMQVDKEVKTNNKILGVYDSENEDNGEKEESSSDDDEFNDVEVEDEEKYLEELEDDIENKEDNN